MASNNGENWQLNDQDIDEQEEVEDSSDDDEGMVDDGTIKEKGGVSGNRGRCVSTATSGSGEISSVTTDGTKVTDIDTFRQHETIMGNMPDIEKATKEVASVVRSKLFKSTKFTNTPEMFEFKPERDNGEPMRGVFYRFLRQECKHQGGDDGIWWAAVQKEVHKSIAKKRTTVTQAMKVAFVGMLQNCLFQPYHIPPCITITHYVIPMITFNNTGAYRKEQNDISLEEIQKMRGSPDGWAFLCNRLLPAVVGTTNWERKVAVQKIAEFTTVSDVAFCLLALENNWDYWVKVASIEDDSNTRTTYPATKWTSSPVMSGKNTGWSIEGLKGSMSCAKQRLQTGWKMQQLTLTFWLKSSKRTM